MKMKKIVSSIAALAIASSAFVSLATVASADSTAVNIDSTTVTGTATVSDGKITVTSGGVSDKDISQEAYLDLGTISEGIVTLTATWEIGSATGTRGYSLFEVQDDTGNAILSYQYNGQGKTLDFNGTTSVVANFDRNTTATVKAIINLYTNKVTVSGVGSHVATEVAFYKNATNVGQIYLKGNAKAGWSNTTKLSNVSYEVETRTVTSADYTINYQLADGTTVKSVLDTGLVDEVVSASAGDVVYDESGTKYFVTEDKSMTLVDGTNVLNVPVRAAEEYAVTVNAIGGIEKNLLTDTAVENDDYSYSYPAYIKDEDGNYYKAEDTTYGETVSNVSAPITKEVTYTLAENVVAFIEGENYVNAGAIAAYSNGSYGYMASTNSVGGQVEVATLPAGKYRIDVAYHNDGGRHGNRGFYFRDKTNTDNGTNTVGGVDIVRDAATGIYTGTMTLTKNTSLSLTGYTGTTSGEVNGKTNQSVYFDYVVITKTGSVDTEITKTNSFSGDTYIGEATAFKVQFKINGDASFNHVKFAVTKGESTGSVEGDVTVLSGDGATVVYGVVVDALVESEDLTVTTSTVTTSAE